MKKDALKYINKRMTESLRSVSTVHLNLVKTVYGVNRSNPVSVEVETNHNQYRLLIYLD
jgi:hypothetical protein